MEGVRLGSRIHGGHFEALLITILENVRMKCATTLRTETKRPVFLKASTAHGDRLGDALASQGGAEGPPDTSRLDIIQRLDGRDGSIVRHPGVL